MTGVAPFFARDFPVSLLLCNFRNGGGSRPDIVLDKGDFIIMVTLIGGPLFRLYINCHCFSCVIFGCTLAKKALESAVIT